MFRIIQKPYLIPITKLPTMFGQKLARNTLGDFHNPRMDFGKYIFSKERPDLLMLVNNTLSDPCSDITDLTIKKEISEYKKGLSEPDSMETYSVRQMWQRLVDLVGIYRSSKKISYNLSGDSYQYTKLSRKSDWITSKKHDEILDKLARTKNTKTSPTSIFERAMELDPLKSFLMESRNKRLSKYLYDKYYLTSLNPELKEACQKISDEFGTCLFVENESNDTIAKLVYEELCEWKKVSQNTFTSPPVININRFESYYVNKTSLGFEDGNVHIKYEDNDFKRTLRHELTHTNTSKYDEDIKIIDGKTALVVNGVDIDTVLNPQTKLHKSEFFNAGLHNGRIEYAYKNRNEFLAVASEGDCSRYSASFRKILVKLGMPKWVFDMKPCCEEVLENAKILKSIQRKYPEIESTWQLKSLLLSNVDERVAMKKKHPEFYTQLIG